MIMTELLNEIASILKSGGVADASNEAARIVHAANTTNQSDCEVVARAMAQRRAAGSPLDFVIGHKEFLGVDLIVAEGALAPREETELLGNTVLDAIRVSGLATPKVIDMCCGSGNLACAIAHHLPTVRVWASDLTDGCIAVARRNVVHVGVTDRVVVAQGDLFAGFSGLGLEGAIDFVVCNPPYISQSKLATERAELLEHEPREAFDGGPYGLSIQQRVVKESLPFLIPGGTLFFEIGLGQERQVKMLFDRAKEYEDIGFVANSAGEVRVVSGRKRAQKY
jgi:release factor glutamine methyltransferase